MLTSKLKSPVTINDFVNTYIDALESVKKTKKLKIVIPTADKIISSINAQIKPTLTALLTKTDFSHITERDLTKVLIGKIKDFKFPSWDLYCGHFQNLFSFSKDILTSNDADHKQAVSNTKIIHQILDEYKSTQIDSINTLAAIFVAIYNKLDGKNYSQQLASITESIAKALNRTPVATDFSKTILANNNVVKKSLTDIVQLYIDKNAAHELPFADLTPLISEHSQAISQWLSNIVSTLNIKEDTKHVMQYFSNLKFDPMLVINFNTDNNRLIRTIRTRMQQLYRRLDPNVQIIPIDQVPDHDEIKKDQSFFASGLLRSNRVSALVDFNGELIGEPTDASHTAIMKRVVNDEKRYKLEDIKAWLEDRGRTAVVIRAFSSMDEIKSHCLQDTKHNFEKVIYYSPDDHNPDGSNINKMIMAKRQNKLAKKMKRLLKSENLLKLAATSIDNMPVRLYINGKWQIYYKQDIMSLIDTKVIPETVIDALLKRIDYFNKNSDRVDFAKSTLTTIVTNPTKNIFYQKINVLGINLYPAQWQQLSGYKVFNDLLDRKYADLDKKIRTGLFNKFSNRIDRIIQNDVEITTANGDIKLSQINPNKNIRLLALLFILGSKIDDDSNANPERYIIPYVQKSQSPGREPLSQKIIMYHGQEYTFNALTALVNKVTGLNIGRRTINGAYNNIKNKFKDLPKAEQQAAISKVFSEYIDEMIRKKQLKGENKLTINGKPMSLTEAAEQTKFSYKALIQKKRKIKDKILAEHPDWTVNQIDEECTKRLSKELEAVINKQTLKAGIQIFTINGIDYTLPQIAQYILKYDYSSVHEKYSSLIKDMGEIKGHDEFIRLVQQEIDQPGTTFLAKGMRKTLKPTMSHTLTINGETKTLRDWSRDERIKLYSTATHCIDNIYNAAIYKGETAERAMELARNTVQRILEKRPAMGLVPIQINGTWQCKTKAAWVRDLIPYVTNGLRSNVIDDFQIKCQEIINKLYANCMIEGSTKLVKDWLDLLGLNNIENYKILKNHTLDEIQLLIMDLLNKEAKTSYSF